jgi:putative peptidoglycan lipid II flippase
MNLFKSTVTVSFFTFLSRITGFLRDMVVARSFGANIWTDAFFVAFKIPNFLRRLFAEGSFSLAFIPVLNEIKARNDRRALKAFIDRIAGSLLAVTLIVFAVMEIFAPAVIAVFAPGYLDKPEVYRESVSMLRMTLPYLPLVSLVAFAGGILNSHHRFALPAATPILLNLALIASALWLKNQFDPPVKALAFGVLAAGILQLLAQLPALWRMGLLPRPRWGFGDPQIKKVLRLMGPTLFGSSIAQLNLLLDTIIATFLPLAGSVSFLYYSDRLLEFPLGVFGIAISTVILPALSFQHASDQRGGFLQTLRWAVKLALVIALPAAIALAILAKPVVISLFEYGRFDAFSSHMTALSLMAYMLGLPAFVLNKVLLPAFYSRKDTRTPVKIGIYSLLANMLLNIVLTAALWWSGVAALHMALALASAISAWLQTVLLYRALRRTAAVSHSLFPWRSVQRMALASIVMGLILWLGLWWLQAGLGWDWHQSPWYLRITALSGLIVAGLASYGGTLWLLGIDPRQLLHQQSSQNPNP